MPPPVVTLRTSSPIKLPVQKEPRDASFFSQAKSPPASNQDNTFMWPSTPQHYKDHATITELQVQISTLKCTVEDANEVIASKSQLLVLFEDRCRRDTYGLDQEQEKHRTEMVRFAIDRIRHCVCTGIMSSYLNYSDCDPVESLAYQISYH